MKINGGALEFFESLPDDILVKIAEYDWEALERLCNALTLDLELLRQEQKYFDERMRQVKKDLAS
jgi:hypothetical protein